MKIEQKRRARDEQLDIRCFDFGEEIVFEWLASITVGRVKATSHLQPTEAISLAVAVIHHRKEQRKEKKKGRGNLYRSVRDLAKQCAAHRYPVVLRFISRQIDCDDEVR